MWKICNILYQILKTNCIINELILKTKYNVGSFINTAIGRLIHSPHDLAYSPDSPQILRFSIVFTAVCPALDGPQEPAFNNNRTSRASPTDTCMFCHADAVASFPSLPSLYSV